MLRSEDWYASLCMCRASLPFWVYSLLHNPQRCFVCLWIVSMCCLRPALWVYSLGHNSQRYFARVMWLLLLLLFAGVFGDARNETIEASYTGLLAHALSWVLQEYSVAKWLLQYRHVALWGLVCFAFMCSSRSGFVAKWRLQYRHVALWGLVWLASMCRASLPFWVYSLVHPLIPQRCFASAMWLLLLLLLLVWLASGAQRCLASIMRFRHVTLCRPLDAPDGYPRHYHWILRSAVESSKLLP